jgi:hypothetical protein
MWGLLLSPRRRRLWEARLRRRRLLLLLPALLLLLWRRRLLLLLLWRLHRWRLIEFKVGSTLCCVLMVLSKTCPRVAALTQTCTEHNVRPRVGQGGGDAAQRRFGSAEGRRREQPGQGSQQPQQGHRGPDDFCMM